MDEMDVMTTTTTTTTMTESTIEKYDCESSVHSDFEYIQNDSLMFESNCDENTQTVLAARCSSFTPSILKRSLCDELSSSQEATSMKSDSAFDLHQFYQLDALKESLEETAEQVMILLMDRTKQKELVNELKSKVQRLEIKNERLKTNVERRRKCSTKESQSSLTKMAEKDISISSYHDDNKEAAPATGETWKKFIYIFIILLIAVIIGMQLQVRKFDSHNILLKSEVNKLTHKLTRYETVDLTFAHGDVTLEIKKCQSLSEQNEKVSLENMNLRQENTILATIIIIFVLFLIFKLFFSCILNTLQLIEKKV